MVSVPLPLTLFIWRHILSLSPLFLEHLEHMFTEYQGTFCHLRVVVVCKEHQEHAMEAIISWGWLGCRTSFLRFSSRVLPPGPPRFWSFYCIETFKTIVPDLLPPGVVQVKILFLPSPLKFQPPTSAHNFCSTFSTDLFSSHTSFTNRSHLPPPLILCTSGLEGVAQF